MEVYNCVVYLKNRRHLKNVFLSIIFNKKIALFLLFLPIRHANILNRHTDFTDKKDFNRFHHDNQTPKLTEGHRKNGDK